MSKNKDAQYENELLDAWEETYKKGQLSFWIFLALKDGEKYTDEIRSFVSGKTNETLVCEEQSLYRALRKYRDLGMVDFRLGPGDSGPERKYYYLTALGSKLLERFIERNILLFFNPNIKELINRSPL